MFSKVAHNCAFRENPELLQVPAQNAFPSFQRRLTRLFPPKLENAFELTFGPTVGLFFWTPLLLMSLVGYAALLRRSPRLFWICYLAPVLQIGIFSAFYDWTAGGGLGPRYPAPALALLALPTALGIARLPRCGIFLALASILLTGIGTMINPCPATGAGSPITRYYLPALKSGEFAPNLGSNLGLSGYWSLLPLLIFVGVMTWILWRATREPAPTEAQGR